MSKHPTSDLTPRDLACIEYGRQLEKLFLIYYSFRNFNSIYHKGTLKKIKECRAVRERIFRLCGFCKHTGHGGSSWCEYAQGYVHMREDLASICEHYEERREP